MATEADPQTRGNSPRGLLVDTNVLLRRTQPSHEHHFLALEAVAHFLDLGETLYFTHQNIAEFWSVATRPRVNNGLALSPEQTLAEVRKLERFLHLLPDTQQAYIEWKLLIVRHSVTGVRVHDARLVSLMKVHGINRILTFDKDDFKTFGLEVIHPASVVSFGPRQ